MNKHELMARAGVPVEAQKTTLTREGLQTLRDRILDGSANAPGAVTLLHPASASMADAGAAELAFYLVVKELALNGIPVACIDLAELCAMLSDNESEKAALPKGMSFATVDTLDTLAVSSFCTTGPTYVSPQQTALVSALLLRRLRSGKSLILSMSSPSLLSLESWWPVTLRSYLVRNAYTRAIGAGVVE
jgi:hypothetical protein